MTTLGSLLGALLTGKQLLGIGLDATQDLRMRRDDCPNECRLFGEPYPREGAAVCRLGVLDPVRSVANEQVEPALEGADATEQGFEGRRERLRRRQQDQPDLGQHRCLHHALDLIEALLDRCHVAVGTSCREELWSNASGRLAIT